MSYKVYKKGDFHYLKKSIIVFGKKYDYYLREIHKTNKVIKYATIFILGILSILPSIFFGFDEIVVFKNIIFFVFFVFGVFNILCFLFDKDFFFKKNKNGKSY